MIDPFGVAKNVDFSRPDEKAIKVEISLHPLTGYTSTIGDAVKQAVVDYIAALSIGADVVTTRLYLPANLYGAADSATFELTLIRIALLAGSFGTADITIAFDELATLLLANVTLLIV